MGYVGIDFNFYLNVSFEMRQPYLIQNVIDLVEHDGDSPSKPSPNSLPLLHKDVEGMEYHQHCHYM